MNDNDSSGAILLCGHIAVEGRPILRGRRDRPMSPEDSGWQFRCNKAPAEYVDDAQIWSISEVLEMDPTIAPIIDEPFGTTVERSSPEVEWVVAHFEPDEVD